MKAAIYTRYGPPDVIRSALRLRREPRVLRVQARPYSKADLCWIGGGGPDTSSLSMVSDMVSQMLLSWFVSQKPRGFIAKTGQEDLATLGELITSGRVTPIVDRRFPWSDVSEAIRYLEAGHARGKVIVT